MLVADAMSSDVVQEEAECGTAEAGEREERDRLVASLRAEDMLPGHEGLKSGVLKNGLRYCFFPQQEACGAFRFYYTHTVLLLQILLHLTTHTHRYCIFPNKKPAGRFYVNLEINAGSADEVLSLLALLMQKYRY